jgi:hypothetical protein
MRAGLDTEMKASTAAPDAGGLRSLAAAEPNKRTPPRECGGERAACLLPLDGELYRGPWR